jgi:hypothetical protein
MSPSAWSPHSIIARRASMDPRPRPLRATHRLAVSRWDSAMKVVTALQASDFSSWAGSFLLQPECHSRRRKSPPQREPRRPANCFVLQDAHPARTTRTPTRSLHATPTLQVCCHSLTPCVYYTQTQRSQHANTAITTRKHRVYHTQTPAVLTTRVPRSVHHTLHLLFRSDH